MKSSSHVSVAAESAPDHLGTAEGSRPGERLCITVAEGQGMNVWRQHG